MKAYVLLLLMVFPGIALGQQIDINEVMASNHIALLDEDGIDYQEYRPVTIAATATCASG